MSVNIIVTWLAAAGMLSSIIRGSALLADTRVSHQATSCREVPRRRHG